MVVLLRALGFRESNKGGVEMRLKKVEEKYKNEWVLAEVLKEDESGEPTEVKIIAHSKNRDDTYAAMEKAKGKYTYHFYTGKIPKKGYAVAFYVTTQYPVENVVG